VRKSQAVLVNRICQVTGLVRCLGFYPEKSRAQAVVADTFGEGQTFSGIRLAVRRWAGDPIMQPKHFERAGFLRAVLG
jgi:hypothetical protein